jgi:hypothetical protein
MGMPEPVVLDGQKVFLCCNACIKKAKSDARRTLETVARLRAAAKAGTHRAAPAPGPAAAGHGHGGQAAKNRAALALLGADRPLAEAQEICPVTDKPLGAMGKPIKVMVKGQPIFVCCDGCSEEVRDNEAAMLEKVAKLKAKAAEKKKAVRP